MALTGGDEPPHIDSTLDPIRAAIQMVADGSANRVTVVSSSLTHILPAARQLARAAGVVLEAIEPHGNSNAAADLVVSSRDTRRGA